MQVQIIERGSSANPHITNHIEVRGSSGTFDVQATTRQGGPNAYTCSS